MANQLNRIVKELRVNLLFLLVLCWMGTVNGFYTEITPEENGKCYMITTFPSENILIHIKVPSIQDSIKIEVECFVEGQLIFTKEIKKPDDKITVSLDNSVSPGKIEEAVTCIRATIMASTQEERMRIKNNRYLVWFSQHGNFIKHIENSAKSRKGATEIHREDLLKSIREKIGNMNETYEEQLVKFNRSEESDRENEKLLAELISEAYYFSIIETVIIFGSGIAYCWILSKHL